MQEIIYAGESFITSNAIAQAVLAYSQALALNDLSDRVTIPVVDGGGDVVDTTLLIGPASQLVAQETLYSETELPEEVVAELEEKRAKLLDRQPVRAETAPDSPIDLDLPLADDSGS